MLLPAISAPYFISEASFHYYYFFLDKAGEQQFLLKGIYTKVPQSQVFTAHFLQTSSINVD